MGSDVSKEIKEIVDILGKDEELCSTPENRVIPNVIGIDPRSPTEGILRSPIVIKKEATECDEACIRLKCESHQDITPVGKNQNTKTLLHVLRIDPRSPTLGISRTPIQVECDIDKDCERITCNDIAASHAMKDVDEKDGGVVPDCRSPSLGICRTPIQVSDVEEPKSPGIVLEPRPNEDVNAVLQWHTPLNRKSSGATFVYTDDEDFTDTKSKKEIVHHEYNENSVNEKENDNCLRRKIIFTPESVKTGVKVRTPLGSRCNFQDSPSRMLKMMQVQKVGQELGSGLENSSSNLNFATKTSQKKHALTEHDKDTVLIL